MPKQRPQDPGNDAPGMEPDARRKFHVVSSGPDEPGAEDTEGHRARSATEPAPDEPGAEETEGHASRGRGATEPAPDEPGADMNPDAALKVKF